MEKAKKKKVVEILKKQFENSSNFRTDWNLKNEQLIEEVKKYLDENGLYDFIDTDSKYFEIQIYFIEGRQYQSLALKHNGQEKFVFDLTLNETLELIK